MHMRNAQCRVLGVINHACYTAMHGKVNDDPFCYKGCSNDKNYIPCLKRSVSKKSFIEISLHNVRDFV